GGAVRGGAGPARVHPSFAPRRGRGGRLRVPGPRPVPAPARPLRLDGRGLLLASGRAPGLVLAARPVAPARAVGGGGPRGLPARRARLPAPPHRPPRVPRPPLARPARRRRTAALRVVARAAHLAERRPAPPGRGGCRRGDPRSGARPARERGAGGASGRALARAGRAGVADPAVGGAARGRR